MKKLIYTIIIILISFNYSLAETIYLDCKFLKGKRLKDLEITKILSPGDLSRQTVELDLSKKKIISGPHFFDKPNDIVDRVFLKFEKNKIIWNYETIGDSYLKRTVILNRINGEMLINSVLVIYENKEKTEISYQLDYQDNYQCEKIKKLL